MNNETTQTYIQGILAGDRVLLSRAITLVESSKAEHQAMAQAILADCLPKSGNSIRVGITGVPGVGKSTFIEALGKYLTNEGKRVAVLAVDPSSNVSGGSILGDKTRMNDLANNPNAYIRPTPSGGSLGGVAQKTRETIILCEAAGYDTILIETVGVGQSETAVHSMTDFFLLLVLAGAGDELQGMKRGIMELADAVVVNKADGENAKRAIAAMVDYKNALHLFPPQASGWIPRTGTCSATEGTGIKEVWDMVLAHHQLLTAKGYLTLKRQQQNTYWLHEQLQHLLKQTFYHHPAIEKQLKDLEADVANGKITATAAATQLMGIYTNVWLNG